jgi:hypothetical protein
MVILHPMDDDFNGLWLCYIQWMMILKDPNGLWSFYIQWMMMILHPYGCLSFTSNKGDHEE